MRDRKASLNISHHVYSGRLTRLELAGLCRDTWNEPGPEILQLLANTNIPLEMRGDNIFAVGRKVSSHIERYPKQLYD